MYVPQSLWGVINGRMLEELSLVKVGRVEDLKVFMGVVIDQEAFEKVGFYIEYAREHLQEHQVVYGRTRDGSEGWFVTPTVVVTSNPRGKLMTEEIFGPVLAVLVYPDNQYEETLRLCDEATHYGLTGAVFAQDRQAVAQAERALRFAAGNFYINDKPTGAVVGRQPFGGARRSGTNDKAGFWLNVARWLAPRAMKETLVPARQWRRPYLG